LKTPNKGAYHEHARTIPFIIVIQLIGRHVLEGHDFIPVSSYEYECTPKKLS